MNMSCYSDSSGELDEQLPVSAAPTQRERRHLVSLGSPDAEDAATCSRYNDKSAPRARMVNVMNISSDSDDDTNYVPLAQRLRQRQINNSYIVSNGKGAQQCVPSSVANLHYSCRNDIKEPILDQGNHGVSGWQEVVAALPQWWQPLKLFPNAGQNHMSPVKRKASKHTVEGSEPSREQDWRRTLTRDIQQREKNALRLEQKKANMEQKGRAEAAKALRPEEYIQHMVVAVDPGNKNTLT